MSAKRWEVWICPMHGICPDDSDFIEGQDPNLANASDPDGWTGVLYCGFTHSGEACYEEVEQIWVVPEGDSKLLSAPETPTGQNPPDEGLNAGRMAETSPQRPWIEIRAHGGPDAGWNWSVANRDRELARGWARTWGEAQDEALEPLDTV